MEMDTDDTIGAGANIDSNDDGQLGYLPLVDNEGKLLPLHFINRSEVGKEESIMREWMECLVTKGGTLVAVQKLGKRPTLVKQMLDEWLDRYRQLAQLEEGRRSSPSHGTQTFSSDGETDDE